MRLQEIKSEAMVAKKIEKKLKEEEAGFRDALQQSKDIALSGRMATSGVMTSVDASLAVAHAMTTHAIDADIDWFTAVDDLVEEDTDESGAGHLETQEFSSGVFYRYASLNIKQLQVNLGLLSGMDANETAEGRTKALEIASHAMHLLATITPSAKQNSFAAHNLADLVFVSFGNLPVSLANAFEQPVSKDRNGGFITPSMIALSEYWDKIHRGYQLDERSAHYCLNPCEMEERKETLGALEEWIKIDGKSA